MYTSIYSEVSKVRQVRLFFENTKPNPCKISLWQWKTNLQNHEYETLPFHRIFMEIQIILVWKGEKKSRETTNTWKCFYNPFCHRLMISPHFSEKLRVKINWLKSFDLQHNYSICWYFSRGPLNSEYMDRILKLSST